MNKSCLSCSYWQRLYYQQDGVMYDSHVGRCTHGSNSKYVNRVRSELADSVQQICKWHGGNVMDGQIELSV